MGIAIILRLFSKKWGFTSNSVLAKKLGLALLVMIPNEEPRKENWTSFENNTFETKDPRQRKSGSVVEGISGNPYT